MCGICGSYGDTRSEDLGNNLDLMLAAIRHRGTTDGKWIWNHVGLASRRLPIIDVLHSSQPLFNEDNSLVLIGNGEIYNYKELKTTLLEKGHQFRTYGDLECILHLYEEYDDQLWNELKGMFAIALYDIHKNKLILGRDHMGIKPLFYFKSPTCFLFGSEIKSIKAHPEFSSELNPQAISDYLSLQFVPKPQTIYKQVFSLPPASILTLENNTMEIKSYWKLDVSSNPSIRSEDEISLATLDLLKGSVRRRLMADVPMGILLSGGVDSSAIAVLAAQMQENNIKTFSIVFKEHTFDESPYSRGMADYLKSDHHELVIDEDTVIDSLDEISYYFDEPFCEGSAIPLYHICRYAKDYVTVILSGEGSDEIFCGYEIYTAQHLAKYYRWIPYPLHKLFYSFVHRLPVSDNKVSLDMKLRRFTDGVFYNPAKAHFWWRCSMNDREKANILSKEFAFRLDRINTSELYETVFNSTSSDDVINRIMVTDCLIHLVDDLMLRADRMSMAHTMELREPFLDIDLVNYAFSIPSKYKIKGLYNKIPLRNAIAGLMPDKIRKRAKMGLNMPYQKWFKQKRWREFLNDHLGKDSIESFGIFNYPGVQAIFADHVKGLRNNAHALWTILNLTVWLRNHK